MTMTKSRSRTRWLEANAPCPEHGVEFGDAGVEAFAFAADGGEGVDEPGAL